MQPATSPMRLVVAGAAGRMGRMLVQAVQSTPGAVLAGAIERAGSPALGQDAGALAGLAPLGVPVSDAEAMISSTPRRALRFAIARLSVRRARRSTARRPGTRRRYALDLSTFRGGAP